MPAGAACSSSRDEDWVRAGPGSSRDRFRDGWKSRSCDGGSSPSHQPSRGTEAPALPTSSCAGLGEPKRDKRPRFLRHRRECRGILLAGFSQCRQNTRRGCNQELPMANDSDLLPYIDRLRSARVLCIGDVMLDHYVFGQVERVSPEAPIPVLWIEREMKSLGGAGNVLRNLRALGAAASFISVVGNDDAGREIGRLVEAQDGAEAHVLVQDQRPTTVKTRYVAGNQQLLRADRESAIPLDPYIREDLLRLARELVADHPVVVVSDYAKGVLTEGVALEIIRAAREAGARVIVDPKGGDPIRYRGADLLKPNRRELAHATGMPVATENEVVVAARALIERCGFATVLVSLGSEGMALVGADGVIDVQHAQVRRGR